MSKYAKYCKYVKILTSDISKKFVIFSVFFRISSSYLFKNIKNNSTNSYVYKEKSVFSPSPLTILPSHISFAYPRIYTYILNCVLWYVLFCNLLFGSLHCRQFLPSEYTQTTSFSVFFLPQCGYILMLYPDSSTNKQLVFSGLFFPGEEFFFILFIVLGVHCDIYKSSYNIS
jgi:hypothetical protein